MPPQPLRMRRRTKIVATLGPASNSPETVARLIDAGVDVFRMNMSHGTHDDHRRLYRTVEAAAADAGAHVGILVDLMGPKIRVGTFAGGGIRLQPGEDVTVTTREVEGGPGLIPSQYPDLAADVDPGGRILLADGIIELAVEAIEAGEIRCRVVHGGWLSDRKGMNLPGIDLTTPSVTPKDRTDASFALDLGADFLALSFVRRAADVAELRAVIPPGNPVKIIAKIERPEAIDQIDEILEEADGIMVARGDLGVELPPEAVPAVQRQLLLAARRHSKPSIVATQMLESMVESPHPTRAEVSDVSTAVVGGADAVMLSAETAAGAYPVEAVAMMDRIARHTEGQQLAEWESRVVEGMDERRPPLPLNVAVARATVGFSRDLMVRAIVVLSRSGTSARIVSAARPTATVVAATANPAAARQMALLWGIIPFPITEADVADLAGLACRIARELDLARPGEYLLTVAGFASEGQPDRPSVTVVTA